MKEITVKQYSELRGISVQAVCQNLRAGAMMPGIKKAEKFGRDWKLSVDESQVTESSKTKPKKNVVQ